MLESVRKVSFGPSSWSLLALFLGSIAALVGQWHDTGQFPDTAAWMSVVSGVAFAGLRTLQAVAQDRAEATSIPGGVVIDPDPVEGSHIA